MMFSQQLIFIEYFKRLTKVLIRLCVCAGWSETLLVAHTTLLEIFMLRLKFPIKRKLGFRSFESEIPYHYSCFKTQVVSLKIRIYSNSYLHVRNHWTNILKYGHTEEHLKKIHLNALRSKFDLDIEKTLRSSRSTYDHHLISMKNSVHAPYANHKVPNQHAHLLKIYDLQAPRL